MVKIDRDEMQIERTRESRPSGASPSSSRLRFYPGNKTGKQRACGVSALRQDNLLFHRHIRGLQDMGHYEHDHLGLVALLVAISEELSKNGKLPEHRNTDTAVRSIVPEEMILRMNTA